MSEGNSDLYVVVTGTAFDGLDIHGPFTLDNATLWAFDSGQPYEIVCLHDNNRGGTVDALIAALAHVEVTSEQSSNDNHIAALIDALDSALILLGIERPEEVDDGR